jgi:hypothetical protein
LWYKSTCLIDLKAIKNKFLEILMQHKRKRNSDIIFKRWSKTPLNEIFKDVFFCQNILILRQMHPPVAAGFGNSRLFITV